MVAHLPAGDPAGDAWSRATLPGDACVVRQDAYEQWTYADRHDRYLAFAAYVAMRGHEEHAARLYERAIAHVLKPHG
jgi:hypothetical protein